MREEESNWLSKLEEDQLPSPDELISLSQSLITPDLASAFNIEIRGNNDGVISPYNHHHYSHHNSAEFDSSSAELGGGGSGGGGGGGASSEEPARTLKRPRLVWTPQLHKRFVEAVAHLGIKNAVPKTIMQFMSVDGLTRENVASHLQKYRLYLKRMQLQALGGSGCGPGGPNTGSIGSGDPVTDRLFASSPVPPHFLHQVGGPGNGLEHFIPYGPISGLNHPHQMAGHHQIQAQYQHHHRQMSGFGPGQGGGPFENPFMSRQAHLGPNRNGIMVQNNSGYMEDLESARVNNGRKVLTLFPTRDD